MIRLQPYRAPKAKRNTHIGFEIKEGNRSSNFTITLYFWSNNLPREEFTFEEMTVLGFNRNSLVTRLANSLNITAVRLASPEKVNLGLAFSSIENEQLDKALHMTVDTKDIEKFMDLDSKDQHG